MTLQTSDFPESVSEDSIGLLDHMFFDKNQTASVEVFRLFLGFNQADSRALTPMEKKANTTSLDEFLSRHMNHKKRAINVWIVAGNARKLKAPTIVNRNIYACCICPAFSSVLPGWHLKDPGAGETPCHDSISQLTKEQMTGFFKYYLHEDSNTTSKSKRSDIGIEHHTLLACSLEVYYTLVAKLETWDKCSKLDQKLLAEAAFGIYTLFGPLPLKHLADKVPAIMDYFHFLLQCWRLDQEHKKFVDASDPANFATTLPLVQPKAPKPDAILSMARFYEMLLPIAQKGIDSPNDPVLVEELTLLLQQLDEMKKLPSLDHDSVAALFETVIQLGVTFGKELRIDEFSDNNFLLAHREAWYQYFDHGMQSPVPENYILKEIECIRHDMGEMVAEIKSLQATIADTDKKRMEAEVILEKADFRGRREIQKTITGLDSSQIVSRSELYDLIEDAITVLLPPGVTIDTLPAGQEHPMLSCEHYDPTAVDLLRKALSENFYQNNPSTFEECVTAAIESTSESELPVATSKIKAVSVQRVLHAGKPAMASLPLKKITFFQPVSIACPAIGTSNASRVTSLPERPEQPVSAIVSMTAPSKPLKFRLPLISNEVTAKPVVQGADGEMPPSLNSATLGNIAVASKATIKIQPAEIAPAPAVAVAAVKPVVTTAAPEAVAASEPTDNVAWMPVEGQTPVSTAHYITDSAETNTIFKQTHTCQGQVPAVLAENIALHWLSQGHPNFAFATLLAAENVEWVEGAIFDRTIIRASYFGTHVWPGDQAGLSTIQRQLNFISHQAVDDALNRRHGSKLVPYLIFCACFQPSIFSGNYTNAPRLLAQVADCFDESVRDMIEEIVIFSNPGNRLDLETLRLKQPVDAEKTKAVQLRMNVLDWRERIVNKQTGWAPARKALNDCLSQPEFAIVIAAIDGSGPTAADSVQAFVDKYSDAVTVNDLINSQVAKVQPGTGVPHIEPNARNWLQNNIQQLCDIGQNWLIEHRNRQIRTTDTQVFAERLMTRLRTVQAKFDDIAKRHAVFEHKCGARMAHASVTGLLLAIDGDLTSVWPHRRVQATFLLPEDLFAIDGLKNDYPAQLAWLSENMVTPFDLKDATHRALKARDFRLAQLCLMLRQDHGEDVGIEIQDVKKHSDTDRRLLRQKVDMVQTMVHNASLVNLIDDERMVQLSGDIDYVLEQIDTLDALDSVRKLDVDVDSWERDLQSKFSEETQRNREKLDDLVRKARVQLGEDAVADSWQAQINAALDSQNLAVVDEMLNQLEGAIKDGTSKVVIEDFAPNKLITGFLGAEAALFKVIDSHPNPREIGKHLQAQPINGFDFHTAQANCVNVLVCLAEWRIKPKQGLNQAFYDSLLSVLEYIGFQVGSKKLTSTTEHTLGFVQSSRFKRATIAVTPTETGRPFPFFEDAEGGSSQISIIMAFSDWTTADLSEYLQSWAQPHNRTLILSSKPLSNVERNQLAVFCKNEQITIHHFDPVIAAYMGTLPPNDNKLRNFLFLSTPWTYYNPYTQGDTRRPAPFEMRYGRQNIVKELMQHGGPAILFGGRQLGKTTILHEVVRQFHNPDITQYAYYNQMDSDMARLQAISQNLIASTRERVWGEIYKSLVKAKILPNNRYSSIEDQITAINDEFKKDGPSKVLICMDEIDPILRVDHANDFGIFRGISALVNQLNGRFKVVIAGLENVKRFEDAPNFPLPQLGSARQVSILDAKDAMQLVIEPLRAFGYEFENSMLASSILFTTNRHPGLIHIFCAELLLRVSKRHKGVVGSSTITVSDVDHIARDKGVLNLIRDRFDSTLNLDMRYLVIIYALINSQRSTGFFTASQAKATSELWLFDVFKPMTEKTFTAFLDELVGLGVLRVSTDGREFALRSVNILKLVGSASEVEDKLLKAVEKIEFDDPLSGHAIIEGVGIGVPQLSPLTYRDEKFLIDARAVKMAAKLNKPHHYSVAIIAGSEASGMDLDKLKVSLPALGTYEQNGTDSRSAYEVKLAGDLKVKGLSGFRTLLEGYITQKSLTASTPLMLLAEIEGNLPIAFTLDLLDIANDMIPTTAKLRSNIRVLFLLKPKALWQWEVHAGLTHAREDLHTFIVLDRWGKTALSYLLNQLGLTSGPNEVESLQTLSEGWYFSLLQLLQVRTQKKSARSLAELTGFVGFDKEKSKRLLELAAKSGVTEFEWTAPILIALAENGSFDADDLQIVIMELGPALGLDATLAPAILRWLERLRLINPEASTAKSKAVKYKVNPGIAMALKEIARVGATK